jgi:glutamine cyclotransferase
VKAWVDFKGLLDRKRPDAGQADVLNGIAYDAKADRIFVTGKNFPLLYEIKTKPAR